MNSIRNQLILYITAIAMSTVGSASQAQSLPATGLNRGVNFGNMLEAPYEGAWGLTMQRIFFDKVVEGGFDHIRLPVSWTHHAAETAPYTINPAFFERVDWALAQAESRGINVILNMHHYDALNSNPLAEHARALGIWSQISQRYRRRGNFLYFEILNEPHGAFNEQPVLWNQFMNDALSAIRKFNPTRPVLVGPVRWNSIQALHSTNFRPPPDNNIIITVHNYEPFEFTHQGATWVNPVPPVRTTWTGQRYKISLPWQDWSWSTSVANTNNGIQVTYNEGWAGLYFHSDQGVDLATRLTLTVDQPRQLRIVMRNDVTERVYFLTTGAGGGTYNINLDPSMGAITEIVVQNNTIAATAPFLINKFDIEAAGQTHSVIATELDEVNGLMDSAAAWAWARSKPLYLGEFGAYELADMPSRVAWTTAVRSRAETLGMGWGYWELAADFGVYDPNNSTWRLPLLNALIPAPFGAVQINSITPNTLPQGTTRNYIIEGGDFVKGVTVWISGADVTVNSVAFDSSTQLTANITVGGSAALTQRNVTVTNPDLSTSTLTNGATVTADSTIYIDQGWLDAHGPAPYVLDTEGGSYLLETNVVAVGTAFYVVKPNITFDLNGYKISYNSAGSANKWGVCPYISYHNTEIPPVPGAQLPNGFACTNGTIECVVAGDSCHAIYDFTSNNMTYHDLELVSKGKDSYCIYGRWGSFTVEHCYLDCRSTTTFNRHQGPAAVFGLSALVTARYNCVVGGNSAFVCSHGSIIEKNIMRHSGFATNGYGGWFYRCDNINCSDNIIIPSNGRGILANAGVDHVYENNVILHLEAPNAEFGSALNPPAVRARYDTNNIVYQYNTSLGIGGTALTSASSIYLSNDGSGTNSFTGNHATVILKGTPSINNYAQPVTLEAQGYNQLSQDVIDGNTFRSNHYMVRTAGYDGSSFQQRPLIGNEFYWVDGTTAKDDFVTELNNKLTALQGDFLPHRFAQAQTLVNEAIAQITALTKGVGLQSTKKFWYVMEQETPRNKKITATVSNSVFGSGVDPETLSYFALRTAPVSLGVATQLSYQLLDGVTPVTNASVTAQNDQGDTFILQSDGNGWVSVPIVGHAMDKPLGIGQPFSRVNRTSTTLTVVGYEPWILRH